MIAHLEITDKDNNVVMRCPYLHLLLNEDQQFVVLGMDFNMNGNKNVSFNQEVPDVKVDRMGKLEDISIILQHQLRNSLYIYEWDFQNYPNPEILLLTNILNSCQKSKAIS